MKTIKICACQNFITDVTPVYTFEPITQMIAQTCLLFETQLPTLCNPILNHVFAKTA
jgi:hypothetical protein